MELLQIDSLSNLKNNQSFWDNFVYPLLVAAVIGVVVLIRTKIFRKKNKKEEKEITTASIEHTSTVSEFYQLCQRILPLLIENSYVFKTFGPNSSAAETEPLRSDLTLWKQARIDYLLPNNEKIANLINDNKELIPENNKELFQKLLSHIYAFKKHVENENFDYSEFQFPIEVDKVIKDTCMNSVLNQTYFENIIKRIKSKLEIDSVNQIVLFGSFLFYSTEKNDIDLAILLTISDSRSIKKANRKFEKAKKYFLDKVKKKLHLTVFTNTEKDQYYKFLENNEYKFAVYG
jgi:predicted nucleotidyltransferase